MNHNVTKVHPEDNVLVALNNLKKGERVSYNSEEFILPAPVTAKHKFVTKDMQAGDEIKMYGVLLVRHSNQLNVVQLLQYLM